MRRSSDFPVRRPETGLSRYGDSDWISPFEAYSGSPWQMMRRMQEDMDRMFGQFFAPGISMFPAQTGPGGMQQWSPSVDVSQSEKEWCIEADLPGVNKDDIDINVTDHHLILRAEMSQEEQGGNGKQSGRQYSQRERRYGFFQRVFPLPENVREDDIRCDFKNGVLTVHVPKTDQRPQQGRRIPVQDMDKLPSETAEGRKRSAAELRMTEDLDREPAMAGAKGGESTSKPGAKTGEAKTTTRSRKKA